MSQEEVRGKRVMLRPATERDKRRIYEWAKCNQRWTEADLAEYILDKS